MRTRGGTIELSGSESALVVGALFALGLWPFETSGAKKLLTSEKREAGRRLSAKVSSRWRTLLKAAGLWPAGSAWTADLIAERAVLQRGLVLREAELPLVVLALEVAREEFSENWGEFCIVVPGALQWYPIGPGDLAGLARGLKNEQNE